MVYGRFILRLTPFPTDFSLTIAASALLASSFLGCSGGRAATRTELSPGIVIPHSIAEGHGDDPGPGAERLPKPPARSASSPAPAVSSAAPPGVSASAAPLASASAPPVTATAAPAPTPAPSNVPKGGPPDPDPLRLSDQWEYDLVYESGKVVVGAPHARHFPSPVVSARKFGRFAIELWIGPELVDRIRFDFPGLGLEAPPEEGSRKPLYPPASFSKGVHVRQTVLVPATPRARRAVLVDRATGESQSLPWPPDKPLPDPTQPK